MYEFIFIAVQEDGGFTGRVDSGVLPGNRYML